MSARRRREFEPSGFFVLRTPLLPFDEYLRWSGPLEGPAALGGTELGPALARDRARLRETLIQVFARPEIRDALFVASPSLLTELDASVAPGSERADKLTLSLIRYFTRMTARATPFGLLASCSTGELGDETRLEMRARSECVRHTRLDMDYLCALVQALQQDSPLRRRLRYFPNSSLYGVGDRLRFVEWKLDEAGRSYRLVAVEAAEYLVDTLERARGGAQPDALAAALAAADPEITEQDALEFIDSLIDSQILVCELEPTVSGPEPLPRVVERLAPHAPEAARALREVGDEIGRIDAEGIGTAADRYRGLGERLSKLPQRVELSRLLQVDLFRPGKQLTLGPNVLDEIGRGVELLHRLVRGEQERLVRFREAFQKRYEDREIPLVEALDEDIGIGFGGGDGPASDPSPLLDGLEFPAAEAASRVLWDRRETLLLRRLAEALRDGAGSIELSDADLDAMSASPPPPPLPDAFSVMARVACRSAEALATGEFRILMELAAGPSGATLLGRFCHGDADLLRRVREHLRAEEAHRPGAVFAEVVHLPEGRMGNVLLRPLLRGYEIPFQGVSGAPLDRQILITDLMVSVVGERIVLRSSRLGREVIPRLTSAHNFERRSLSIYRFLCSLQSQGVSSGLIWMWGPLENAPFLPRVTHGRLVLARARWLIGKKETKELAALRGDERYAGAARWRRKRGLPRFVSLSELDNELLIDLENVLSVETLLKQLSTRDSALLLEPFPPPDELIARAPDGSYTHELVIPFVRVPTAGQASAQGAAASPAHAGAAAQVASSRTFPPGGEWVYLKLYGGVGTADRALRDVVRPLIDAAQREAVADRWFFIRYFDPENHLRVRLHGDPLRLNRWLIDRLAAGIDGPVRGQVWRVQLDTYEREIERYGGSTGIELSERVFHADSEAVLRILESIEGDAGAEARWRLALRGTDRLLVDMGFDVPARRNLYKTLRATFEAEFRVDATFRKKLAERFRSSRALVEELVADTVDPAHDLSPGFEILDRRSDALAGTMRELRRCSAAGGLTTTLESLAASFVHMHINRLLRSAQRAHELVIYFFLDRAYEGRLARAVDASEHGGRAEDEA